MEGQLEGHVEGHVLLLADRTVHASSVRTQTMCVHIYIRGSEAVVSTRRAKCECGCLRMLMRMRMLMLMRMRMRMLTCAQILADALDEDLTSQLRVHVAGLGSIADRTPI